MKLSMIAGYVAVALVLTFSVLGIYFGLSLGRMDGAGAEANPVATTLGPPLSAVVNDPRPDKAPSSAAVPASPPDVDPVAPPTFINSIGMTMVGIPGGDFLMGSPIDEPGRIPADDPDRVPDETQHRVFITRAFHMSATEVTQAQWEKVMFGNPSHFLGATLPVNHVTWHEAVAFCRLLSTREGRTYRLPTEAEWEYACRAGARTPFHSGASVESLRSVAWFGGNDMDGLNSVSRPQPVGRKAANAWGLHDMHGNVIEWVADWWGGDFGADMRIDPSGPVTGSLRVARGGAYWSRADQLRAARREFASASYRGFGFRVVLEDGIGAGDESAPPERPEHTPDRTIAGDSAAVDPLPEIETTAPATYRNSVGMVMVGLPGGRFIMGAPDAEEPGFQARISQPREVVITRAFHIGATEVTQTQWRALMGSNPSRVKGDNLPVYPVSWHQAAAYCRALSAREGRIYRLPTEAEWEYACRAGTQTTFASGQDEQALNSIGWYAGNSSGRVRPVAGKVPNAWGLYDMHGNVAEWVVDWFRPGSSGRVDPVVTELGFEKMLRGGTYVGSPAEVRSGRRDFMPPHYRAWGFRVVAEVVRSPQPLLSLPPRSAADRWRVSDRVVEQWTRAGAVEPGPYAGEHLDLPPPAIVQEFQFTGSLRAVGALVRTEQPVSVWVRDATDVNALVRELMPLDSLICLRMEKTDVNDHDLQWIGRMLQLREFHIDAPVSDRGLMALRKLTELRDLRIRGEGITDAGLASLENMKFLARLHVDNASITDEGLRRIAQLPGLEILELSGKGLGDAEMPILATMQNLRGLRLSQSSLTDAGLRAMHGMSNLELFRCADTDTTEAGRQAMRAAVPRCAVVPW